MALTALQVAGEEDPADVSSEQVRVAVALQIEFHSRPGLGVGSVGRENFAGQLIVGLVGQERLKEVVFPVGLFDPFGVPPLEQHHIKSAGHVDREAGMIEQPPDQV